MEELTIKLTKDENNFYTVDVQELEGCVTFGSSISESLDKAKEAIELYLEDAPDNK